MMRRNFLPKTLFGRLVLIIMVPMLLVQITTIFVFYERHWGQVTRHTAGILADDVAIIAKHFADNQTPEGLAETQAVALDYLGFTVSWVEGGFITPAAATSRFPYGRRKFNEYLSQRISYPFSHDLYNDPDRIFINIQFADGVLVLEGSRRVFNSPTWLVVIWTGSTSVIFLMVALLFIRGQVRPIQKLAIAARQIGFGRPVHNFKPEGSREVRLAGRAFKAMRARILRQMVERTEMLAGVSHDLRTPLTRLKLQLPYIPDEADRAGMEADLGEMEAMINGYISFASSATVEETAKTDIIALIKSSIESFGAEGGAITAHLPDGEIPEIPLQQHNIRRALNNLIGNALRFGRHCTITLVQDAEQIQIILDDDGPGIPKDKRVSVLRPFVQLKTKDKTGSGLGLAIANEVILAHGGLLLLGESPMGGLRVRIQLPL